MVSQRPDFTFKHNIKQGRHGWLRLTPAYSIAAVKKYLRTSISTQRILDPFAGTGTTGLVASEMGQRCDLIDLNPFLVWLSKAKTRIYPQEVITFAEQAREKILADIEGRRSEEAEFWVPPISNIDRWWAPERRQLLAEIYNSIKLIRETVPKAAIDLLLVSFCKLLIEWSNAAFNHQSMSFKDTASLQPDLFPVKEHEAMLDSFYQITSEIIGSAAVNPRTEQNVITGDSRQIDQLTDHRYTDVVTSPPYPNRMSYIRELRPYMYWLEYLDQAREAGEMDWQAIGGTWGVATSRLKDWTPPQTMINYPDFQNIIAEISASNSAHSSLMANYVYKYFSDMVIHFSALKRRLSPGARAVYIVGNSKFYEVLVPVQEIYASIMQDIGLHHVEIELLRKRNSKKELYEYAVTGINP